MSIDVITSSALTGTHHGFLGRRGGVSSGIFASLNVGLGSSDDPAAVTTNRSRAIEAVAPNAELVTLYQIHSPKVVTITAPRAERPQADAMVTRTRGLLLGILTADCAPVLFADLAADVVGAAHAGWKGALGGVTDATVAAMEALGASRANIRAAIGPCIARKSYEVSEDFMTVFANDDPSNERFFAGGRAGHAYFDLEGYVAHRLYAAGVGTVDALGLDTLTDAERFFSYRRTTLAGEPDYGRQISLIGLS